MRNLNSKEITLSKEQYLKLGSDHNIMTDMYEMKMGHELRVVGDRFILRFVDDQMLDIFIGYIYNQYLREL
jgi:hypothetical protein|tara:strand:+ start:579 stop:791 length:213 start_codon:yes stop_codon:yes gene_type:complete